ncbi:MAG TPA: TetR/AcrR family transcriptional regulator [Chitinophagales bacterium]|nr:TetR/AcrR family transcriptional regulator [Chitinophagales bacterium]HMV02330.1 TetR/AcrR family transcriptional regulator [Chitinophagales bacterium]HMW94288.1 TetR/AcrR family transcriptional regulator [Chitinophagales bacterium]HMZ68889.1 TetR/AcrR family transcriptional regulator [Chitinophagales bacterium]HMZ93819.1 TetR/AcrR family transcriptional regulator [Chitinophagales bacterium]
MEGLNENKEINLELEDQVFCKAKDLFMSIGIRSTTMDDIAKDLGISKKTLYKVVENKGDLVTQCVIHDANARRLEVDAIVKEYSNPIEQMLQLGIHILNSIKQHKISIIHDLMKFYPESWRIITEHKETYVKEIIKQNLKKGIQSGAYRKDIKIDIYANFFIAGTDICIDTRIFPESEFEFPDIFREYLLAHLRGIVNESSFTELNQLIEKVKF